MTILRLVPNAKSISDEELDAMYEECQAEFKDPNNQWYQLASLVRFRCGVNMSEWPFKEPEQREAQIEDLKRFVQPDTMDTPARNKKKDAISGQLLAKMLSGEKPPAFLRP